MIFKDISALIDLLKLGRHHRLSSSFLLGDSVSQVERRCTLELQHKLHTDLILIGTLRWNWCCRQVYFRHGWLYNPANRWVHNVACDQRDISIRQISTYVNSTLHGIIGLTSTETILHTQYLVVTRKSHGNSTDLVIKSYGFLRKFQ